jgi:hypothetical protein
LRLAHHRLRARAVLLTDPRTQGRCGGRAT